MRRLRFKQFWFNCKLRYEPTGPICYFSLLRLEACGPLATGCESTSEHSRTNMLIHKDEIRRALQRASPTPHASLIGNAGSEGIADRRASDQGPAKLPEPWQTREPSDHYDRHARRARVYGSGAKCQVRGTFTTGLRGRKKTTSVLFGQ